MQCILCILCTPLDMQGLHIDHGDSQCVFMSLCLLCIYVSVSFVYLCICVFVYLCICVFVYAERLTGLHSARRVMSGNSCGHHQSKSSWLLTPAARQPARHSGEKPEIHTHSDTYSDTHTAVCFQKFIHLDVQLSAAVDFRILWIVEYWARDNIGPVSTQMVTKQPNRLQQKWDWIKIGICHFFQSDRGSDPPTNHRVGGAV